ncbi:MAG: SH3 domain-containing protein [Clostridia bacterium]|nr:SH3 domain-containing protein [Clostridia bacterium]
MTGPKRIMRITAGLLCLLMIFSAVSALAETRTIRSGYMVRLRATASSKGKVLDAFPVGTRVNVLSKGDTWCKVRVSGKTGYMMTKYLYPASGSSGGGGGGSGTTRYVWTPSGTTLNLRAEPNSWSVILGSYRVGTAVTVLKQGKMWSRVSVHGKIGYMYSDYLVNSR